jgi:hypothetical protein
MPHPHLSLFTFYLLLARRAIRAVNTDDFSRTDLIDSLGPFLSGPGLLVCALLWLATVKWRGRFPGAAIVLSILGFVLAAMAVFYMTVRREEAFLEQEFGAVYAAYKARTPRFWPRPSLWRDEELLTIRPDLFPTTIRDGLMFLVAIPVFELVDFGQMSGWLHVAANLP